MTGVQTCALPISEMQERMRRIVGQSEVPTVIDADGLTAFAAHAASLRGSEERPVIITPHPGEMARLTGRETAFVNANRVDVAREFATEHHVYVVLKGFRTIVATPHGSIYVNSTGNPGMATAGTGDILTGMIAGILAQETISETFVARLCLAVHLHGLCGDLAAEELGEESMVATDLLRFLPKAFDELRG